MHNGKIRVVVVGGGTAGWLTASLLAADHGTGPQSALDITLVESPEIQTIGVGEGTWPSMRTTLERIGLSETDLIRHCDASFKQGSLFKKWRTAHKQDHYYHPFSLPAGYQQLDLARYWQTFSEQVDFATAATPQAQVCRQGLAPKQMSTPEYAFILNYGYHLDAAKFVALLTRHGTQTLGIRHIQDTVTDVLWAGNGSKQQCPITALRTAEHGELKADLFIDCSGFNALLIDKHYQVPVISKQDVLFNDTALVVQLPYKDEQSPIASCTLSTAQRNGWIWDIGLSSRRGIGYVFSGAHESVSEAQDTLRNYIAGDIGKAAAEKTQFRQLKFSSGYRQQFWVHNCVAVGLSAGFIEPLEASALALIEMSARFISDNLSAVEDQQALVAERFNQRFDYHWQGIVEFLKLHYCLSARDDSDYWQQNRENLDPGLRQKLALWQHQSPSVYDKPLAEELFPAASFQYVYYGMQGKTHFKHHRSAALQASQAQQLVKENQHKAQRLAQALPGNRELINNIKHSGLARL